MNITKANKVGRGVLHVRCLINRRKDQHHQGQQQEHCRHNKYNNRRGMEACGGDAHLVLNFMLL
jgi:hypothetical protein